MYEGKTISNSFLAGLLHFLIKTETPKEPSGVFTSSVDLSLNFPFLLDNYQNEDSKDVNRDINCMMINILKSLSFLRRYPSNESFFDFQEGVAYSLRTIP